MEQAAEEQDSIPFCFDFFEAYLPVLFLFFLVFFGLCPDALLEIDLRVFSFPEEESTR